MQPVLDPDDPDDRDLVLGPTGQLRYLRNERGVRLACYFWPAEHPKAVVHIIHGHGSYLCFDFITHPYSHPGQPSPSYDGSWVQAMNQQGLSVCGIDLQGCGRSDGLRCYIDKFEHYVEDIILFIKTLLNNEVEKTYAGVDDEDEYILRGFPRSSTRFLCGISLGGGLALHAMQKTGLTLWQGAVLMAPMISLDGLSSKGINRMLRYIAWVLNYVHPRLPAVKGDRNVYFPLVQQAYDADPHCWRQGTRVRNALEYLAACQKLKGNLSSIDFPFITFHSELDR